MLLPRESLLLLTGSIFIFFGCQDAESNLVNPNASYSECQGINDSPSHYKRLCDCIQEKGYVFPASSVNQVVIYRNRNKELGEFQRGEKLRGDIQLVENFRAFTSDSSNFVWGEAGTPYTDFELEFFDADGNLMNRVFVSYDGMLWVYPRFGITRWGGLSIKGDSVLRKMLYPYIRQEE